MKLQTWTYFKGDSSEEKTDFMQNYKSDGSTVRNTTISFYENPTDATNPPVRLGAAGLSVDSALRHTKLYRNGTEGSDVTTAATMKLQTWTYFKGDSSEEKTDFMQNYKSDGSTVRNTTISFYENPTDA